RALANLGDLYVNEAFATCHRAHASIAGIPKFLPAYAGLRLVEEVTTLRRVIENPARPLVAIIGGAKVETKAAVVKHLARIADQVLLGGKVALAEELRGLPRVVFPRDDLEGKDIGPQTIENYCQIISKAKTIVWSGPLGIFEEPRFERGTRAVVEAVVRSSAFVVAGGGDTLAALEKFGYRDKIGFVSTGGGAMLEFLGGRKLPGLDALDIG
ncbi:phosphoglycerate kinase, partial [Candidatus Parcubacteria bacterium]|nr:phosphoglycerate kinase [Candidatus Parcubacteria bacterium]